MQRFDNEQIVHIPGVDHPESLSVGPGGSCTPPVPAAKCTGSTWRATAPSSSRPRQPLSGPGGGRGGQPVLCRDRPGRRGQGHARIGEVTTYATGPAAAVRSPGGQLPGIRPRRRPVPLRQRRLVRCTVNGGLYKIDPGGGAARLWYPEAIDTPNAIALDAAERYLYLVETFGRRHRPGWSSTATARRGIFERVVHLPRHVPDGIAFDDERPAVDRLSPPGRYLRVRPGEPPPGVVRRGLDGRGALRGPTDVAFARSGSRGAVCRVPGQPGASTASTASRPAASGSTTPVCPREPPSNAAYTAASRVFSSGRCRRRLGARGAAPIQVAERCAHRAEVGAADRDFLTGSEVQHRTALFPAPAASGSGGLLSTSGAPASLGR